MDETISYVVSFWWVFMMSVLITVAITVYVLLWQEMSLIAALFTVVFCVMAWSAYG